MDISSAQPPSVPTQEVVEQTDLTGQMPTHIIPWRKIFNITGWSFLGLFTPLFFIAYLSQGANPRDLLYPVKRGVEKVILAAASLNPSTRAFYEVDLTDRRFNESVQAMLATRGSVKSFDDFTQELEDTQVSLGTISDPVKKQELEAKLIDNVNTYEGKIEQLQSQIPSATPQAPQIAMGISPQQGSQEIVNQYTNNTTVVNNIDTAGQAQRQQATGSQTSHPLSPTFSAQPPPTRSTTITPSPTPSGGTDGSSDDEKKKLDEVKKKLDDIKKKLEEDKKRHQEQELDIGTTSPMQSRETPTNAEHRHSQRSE